jgi:hypothetical protein
VRSRDDKFKLDDRQPAKDDQPSTITTQLAEQPLPKTDQDQQTSMNNQEPLYYSKPVAAQSHNIKSELVVQEFQQKEIQVAVVVGLTNDKEIHRPNTAVFDRSMLQEPIIYAYPDPISLGNKKTSQSSVHAYTNIIHQIYN